MCVFFYRQQELVKGRVCSVRGTPADAVMKHEVKVCVCVCVWGGGCDHLFAVPHVLYSPRLISLSGGS